jgi:bleomycin hydrolase
MTIKQLSLVLATSALSFPLLAQYTFKGENNIERTAIKNQANTGTCWSFATTSFLEAEAIRMGNKQVDFAEMFNVKKVYVDKAKNYVSRQGKANFSQGSLAHDVIRTLKTDGVIPELELTGLIDGAEHYDHNELEKSLKGFLDGVLAAKHPSKQWLKAFNAILDVYVGTEKSKFTYEGKEYTAKSFAKAMGLDATNYESFTSFTHQPFYNDFVLNIPDNYSNGEFVNVPLNDLMAITNNALKNGFTIAWDGDVSEKGFGRGEGIAILPVTVTKEMFDNPVEEMKVSQEKRQEDFENFVTTDDHLMHVVGTAKDQKGTTYYIIKNSWGETGNHKGYLYMSEAYFKMKTVAITLHKNAVPKGVAKKLKD